ncbi:MAG: undecaprenyl/decaprenyl-phosphate alpha-N-acetylglucosaminyl 1-phosphate transferase [Sedimentisphaerales bacterium]|nr:undecaprenyl/decaprenyl-phosphate alpha-N-acetylglucosaminyl 1-phosphate transferase [Sedimentisphaerales bacterium]
MQHRALAGRRRREIRRPDIAETKYIAILAAAAFVGSVLLTARVRRWARRHDFVDRPGQRKIHHEPIALGGGIVIFWITLLPVAATVIAALALRRWGVPGWLPDALARHVPGLAGQRLTAGVLLVAVGLIHALGLLDDRKHLGPGFKLIVQVLVAVLLATAGQIRFSLFIPSVFGTTLLSVLWIVVIMNAFNFLDNMDGLTSGIAVIAAVIILAAALSAGQVFVSSLLALLIGALLGFLLFNFAPASIFLGDSGSLVVGLLLAVATIRTTYYHQDAPSGAWYAALVPLVVLAVPLYDFVSVTLLRLGQGKSPFVGDQQHFSHRLVKRGMTCRQAVCTIYLATACTGIGATVLHQVSTLGAILIFAQTLSIVLIIAVLEQPIKQTTATATKDTGPPD